MLIGLFLMDPGLKFNLGFRDVSSGKMLAAILFITKNPSVHIKLFSVSYEMKSQLKMNFFNEISKLVAWYDNI